MDLFNFEPAVNEGLDSMGFIEPTPVQAKAIPVIMNGKDLIACAQTGTGKTAAFLLPVINQMCREPAGHTHTLIIVPTRELAIQIDRVLQGFSYFAPVSSITVYGGGDGNTFDKEKKALTTGANIIIATPGRLIAHLNMGYVIFDKLECLVLDEADKMLDMGFVEDIMRIVGYLPKQRQTLMFSATMPPKIRQLADRLLKNPEQINIAVSRPADRVKQEAYEVYDQQKLKLVRHLLKDRDLASVLVFCSTKQKTKEVAVLLKRVGLSADAIHSDLEQAEREEVLRQFRNRKLNILVATDILSRGIDIEDIAMVLNYDVPSDPEDYIHRVGRTARAASTGLAVTFVSPDDRHKFRRIEGFLGSRIDRPSIPDSLGAPPSGNERPSSRGRGRKPGDRRKGRRKGGAPKTRT